MNLRRSEVSIEALHKSLTMSRRSGRSLGKKIRMDDGVPEESGSGSAMDTSGEADEQESSYDPMAFYKQQQQEMLLQATQHVQEAREEIQQAQSQGKIDIC